MSKGKELRKIIEDFKQGIIEGCENRQFLGNDEEVVVEIENLFKDHIPKDEVIKAIDAFIEAGNIMELSGYDLLQCMDKDFKSVVLKIGTKEGVK